MTGKGFVISRLYRSENGDFRDSVTRHRFNDRRGGRGDDRRSSHGAGRTIRNNWRSARRSTREAIVNYRNVTSVARCVADRLITFKRRPTADTILVFATREKDSHRENHRKCNDFFHLQSPEFIKSQIILDESRTRYPKIGQFPTTRKCLLNPHLIFSISILPHNWCFGK